MAKTKNDVSAFAAKLGALGNEQTFKMLLYYADLSGEFESDEDWAAVCEYAVSQDAAHEFTSRFRREYSVTETDEQFADMVESHMRDNYVMAAIALHGAGLPPHVPLIAWNAFNKHSYPGLKDEFAVVKFLHWSGFDINATDGEEGMTALHYFASTKHLPGSHSRAVAWLLAHGADVGAENSNGDTALTYLCAVSGWGRPHSESFVALVNDGSDPFKPSNDGATPYSLLTQLNALEPKDERTYLIGLLDRLHAEWEREQITSAMGSGGQRQAPRRMAL